MAEDLADKPELVIAVMILREESTPYRLRGAPKGCQDRRKTENHIVVRCGSVNAKLNRKVPFGNHSVRGRFQRCDESTITRLWDVTYELGNRIMSVVDGIA